MSNLESIASIEQALIGVVIQDNAALDSLRVSEHELTSFHAKTALVAAKALRARNVVFNEITLADELANTPVKVDYLLAAYRDASQASLSTYEDRILGFRKEQAFLAALDEAKAVCRESGLDAAMASVVERVSNLELNGVESTVTMAKAVSDLAKEISESQGKMRGYPTGVGKLTHMYGGIRPGIVTVVAARPAMGKSSFGLAIAKANAHAGHGVHVFTLEDSREMYAARYLASEAHVKTDDLYASRLQRDGKDRLDLARRRLEGGLPWLLDEASPERPEELVRRVRCERAKNNTKIVIIDYLQIIAASDESARSEHDAIGKCMHVFQQAAKRDNMAYIVMSQLNRKVEDRPDKRPGLADIRGSGTVEERAKFIVAMYRGAYYHEKPIAGIDYVEGKIPPSEAEFREQVQLIVIKNSNGPTGTVTANWKGEYCEIT